jgi:hypothetical protein
MQKSTSTNLFRYECPCGKTLCVKDKKTRDLSVKLHTKKCELAQQSNQVRTNFNYTEGKEIKYKGQVIIGERYMHDFIVPLNELN